MRISDWSSDVCSSDLKFTGNDADLIPGGALVVKCGKNGRVILPGDRDGPFLALRQIWRRPGPLQVFRELADDLLIVRPAGLKEIGRASCRERVCQYV